MECQTGRDEATAAHSANGSSEVGLPLSYFVGLNCPVLACEYPDRLAVLSADLVINFGDSMIIWGFQYWR